MLFALLMAPFTVVFARPGGNEDAWSAALLVTDVVAGIDIALSFVTGFEYEHEDLIKRKEGRPRLIACRYALGLEFLKINPHADSEETSATCRSTAHTVPSRTTVFSAQCPVPTDEVTK
jgi:hypothetical protein